MLTAVSHHEWTALLGDRVRFDEPMRLHTSFHIGGPAQIWAEPADREELRRLVALAQMEELPVTMIGGGANLLVRDTGIPGVVINLNSPAFRQAVIEGTTVTVGAGVGLDRVLALTREAGLAGCEFLTGIPGRVGGSVRMNAGTRAPLHHGVTGWDGAGGFRAMSDVVTRITVLRHDGTLALLPAEAIGFGYRRSGLNGDIVLEATLALTQDDPSQIADRCAALMAYKRATQDLSAPSAGCIFKNPRGRQAAAWLIDRAGLKGLRVGDAVISPRHANFIINAGAAKASDVLALIDAVQYKVLQEHGVLLELEVQVMP